MSIVNMYNSYMQVVYRITDNFQMTLFTKISKITGHFRKYFFINLKRLYPSIFRKYFFEMLSKHLFLQINVFENYPLYDIALTHSVNAR